MYYVNEQQLQSRWDFLATIEAGLVQLEQRWQSDDLLLMMAQERLLSLAIEAVTDIGTFIIDGFMMRDASSYRDIVTVLSGENVMNDAVANHLLLLVDLRRELMQEYYAIERGSLHPLVHQLAPVLNEFGRSSQQFVESNLI